MTNVIETQHHHVHQLACSCRVCHLMAHVEDDVGRDIQATLCEDLLGLPQGLHQYGPLHVGILADITIQGPITFNHTVNHCPDHVHLRSPKVVEALRRLHIPLGIQCRWGWLEIPCSYLHLLPGLQSSAQQFSSFGVPSLIDMCKTHTRLHTYTYTYVFAFTNKKCPLCLLVCCLLPDYVCKHKTPTLFTLLVTGVTMPTQGHHMLRPIS
jgi:hypothetical protein